MAASRDREAAPMTRMPGHAHPQEWACLCIYDDVKGDPQGMSGRARCEGHMEYMSGTSG